MAANASSCFWCDGVCYDIVNDAINGTLPCDRLSGKHPGFSWWAPIQVIQAFFGMFGLGIIGYVLLFGDGKSFRKNTSLMLIGGQLIADLFFCAYIFFINGIPWVFDKEKIFDGRSTGCKVEGMFYALMCATSLSLSAVVSYERYRSIVLAMKKKFKVRKWVQLYLGAWFLSFLFAMMMFATGGYHLIYSKTYCMFDFQKEGNVIVGVLFSTAFLFISGYCYYKIFRLLSSSMGGSQKMKKVAYGLMKFYAFMILCWTPAMVTMLLQGIGIIKEHNSGIIDNVASMGAVFNSAANPYVLFYLYPKLRFAAFSSLGLKRMAAVSPASQGGRKTTLATKKQDKEDAETIASSTSESPRT